MNFSLAKGRDNEDRHTMEIPLNLTPSNLPSNGVSFVIEEEAEEQSVAKRTPRLPEGSAQKPAPPPRETSSEERLEHTIFGEKGEVRRRTRNER